MALDNIVRSVVALASKTSKSLQGEVRHVTWVGQSVSGDVATVTILRRALIEQKQHLRRLSDGRIIEVRATLTFLEVIAPNGARDRVEPVDPKDVFVLPDGSWGPVVDVEGLHDPAKARPFYMQVFLGGSTTQ